VVSVAVAIAPAGAQTSAAEHVIAARDAAGTAHVSLLMRTCTQAAPSLVPLLESAGPEGPAGLPPLGGGRPEWYAEPVKVFDNLYYVGQTEYSAWAVTTSEGIVIIDPIFDYSVEAEIVEGLRKVGLDPADIRYVIVSHGHSDHAGGARHLQDAFGARVVLAPEDWDLLERTGGDWPKPRRDIEAEDGYELRLGETTLTLHATPGHTPGTVSTLLTVFDGGRRHVAALWGGTAYNFMGRGEDARWFREYIASAERFQRLAAAAGADVILSNHTRYDSSTTKLPALRGRRADAPHPFVVGAESVRRYLDVAASCARAGLAGIPGVQ
jgi:metallo-beta-lactamase class B